MFSQAAAAAALQAQAAGAPRHIGAGDGSVQAIVRSISSGEAHRSSPTHPTLPGLLVVPEGGSSGGGGGGLSRTVSEGIASLSRRGTDDRWGPVTSPSGAAAAGRRRCGGRCGVGRERNEIHCWSLVFGC